MAHNSHIIPETTSLYKTKRNNEMTIKFLLFYQKGRPVFSIALPSVTIRYRTYVSLKKKKKNCKEPYGIILYDGKTHRAE